MKLSKQATEILQTLTGKVRLMSTEQIARTWWCDTASPVANARRALRRLKEARLVELESHLVRPELELREPVLSSLPGGPEPELGKVAYALRARWSKPPVPVELVRATKEANRLVGGIIGGFRSRVSELTHDFHLAAVYLHYRRAEPDVAKKWVCENQLRFENRGELAEVPDALVREEVNAAPRLVVEFGGSYRKQKLKLLHDAYSHVPYVIW